MHKPIQTGNRYAFSNSLLTNMWTDKSITTQDEQLQQLNTELL